jgi:chromate reductase
MKKIIAVSGSLRKDSFNTRLLQEVVKFAPEGMEIEIFDIGGLPLYDQDLEQAFPVEVQKLKDAIKRADGIIIATPEHNRSIPSALKNAIDWASRPWGQNSFPGKSVLVIGASVGPIATAVAQQHLKQIMLYLDAHVIGQPEFYLGNVQDKFNDKGELTDEATKEHIQKALVVLMNR